MIYFILFSALIFKTTNNTNINFNHILLPFLIDDDVHLLSHV